jgi:hypothetical protein
LPEDRPVCCLSCGVPQPGRFCAACGEKRISSTDFSIEYFFEDAFEHLTHFDLKSLRAVTLLVKEPGRLTRDYLDGRRRGRPGPIQLFVIVNVVFALLIGFTTWRPLDTPLSVQTASSPLLESKRHMVDESIKRKGITSEEFEREYNTDTKVESKEWVFAMIPVFAATLAVLFWFRRYFFEHLVFATHYYSFVLLSILVWAFGFDFIVRPAERVAGLHINPEETAAVVLSITLAIYLYLALRRVYGAGAVTSVLRAAALSGTLFLNLQIYRLLLFFVTMWMMH